MDSTQLKCTEPLLDRQTDFPTLTIDMHITQPLTISV